LAVTLDPLAFGKKLDDIRDSYDGEITRLVAAVRAIGRDEVLDPPEDALREAHLRIYCVDPILRELGWRIGTIGAGPPNIVAEAAIGPAGKRYFLDYLAVDHGGRVPLMVGETKRPGSPHPTLASNQPRRRRVPPREAVPFGGEGDLAAAFGADDGIADVPRTLSKGLQGDALQGDWAEWLSTLKAYIVEVKARWGKTPRRVWMTDGEWLLIFVDPEGAFTRAGGADPATIKWYGNWEEVRRASTAILELLGYDAVLDRAPAIASAQVGFYVERAEIVAAMHGLKVIYQDVHQLYGPDLSTISVAPILFLRTTGNAWLRVETFNAGQVRQVPRVEAELEQHIRDIERVATELRRDVEAQLGGPVPTWTLREHYSDANAFQRCRGVQPDGREVFLVATGEHLHFFRLVPSIGDCRWHDWHAAHADGVAAGDAPAEFAAAKKRVLFLSQRPHHCAHVQVMAAKTGPVREENRDRCGHRSSDDDGPFCEIFSFEQHLCCRTCAFEDVCTAAPVFRLPCTRGAPRES
jgi:hypothetical protein